MIDVTISRLLCSLAALGDETRSFQLDAASPVECLQALVREYPSVAEWVYEPAGGLRRQVRFYVNGIELPEDAVSTTLKDDDRLYVFFFHM